MLEKSNKIIISDSAVHGRGVFAIETIEAGETLEECHFLLLQQEMPSQLQGFAFGFPSKDGEKKSFAIVLGSGTVYNHSDEPSAAWLIDIEKNCYRFFALRRIEVGEEIFTNYCDMNPIGGYQ